MAHTIGFTAEWNTKQRKTDSGNIQRKETPRRSLVQVYFPTRNMTLGYYNDLFDLQCGDLVYVEGKLEGLVGKVVEVSYTFKIKITDYKRVIGIVDNDVHGQFYVTGSHLITFDRQALPFKKILTWYKAPTTEEEEYVYGEDESAFLLEDLGTMGISSAVAERGHEYYVNNQVVYVSIDGTHGHAIVEGSEPYEVEFNYNNGQISNMVCNCFCGYACKHEFAAMLQLRESLGMIEKQYSEQYKEAEYFVAVSKAAMIKYVIHPREQGAITL